MKRTPNPLPAALRAAGLRPIWAHWTAETGTSRSELGTSRGPLAVHAHGSLAAVVAEVVEAVKAHEATVGYVRPFY